MRLAGIKILIISPESWAHIHVSKHHYAIELAQRGNQVFFLNPPGSEYNISDTEYKNVTEVNYSGFLPGLYRMPRAIRIWNQKSVLCRIEKMTSVQFDVVWSFDNSVFYDFDAFGPKPYKVSHIVDLGQDFLTERAAKSADLCLGVIPQIVERLKHYNPNTHLIRHGVKLLDCKEAVELPGENHFKALYIGNMGMPDLDWGLMSKATVENPEIDFIFIGPQQQIVKSKLGTNSNVFTFGKVRSEELPCYMSAADALLLFYKKSYFQKYASPHKMMEYLSSGKPIVTSHLQDYEAINDLVLMSVNGDDWLYNLKYMQEHYVEYMNNSMRLLRVDFAKANTYNRQIERIERIMLAG